MPSSGFLFIHALFFSYIYFLVDPIFPKNHKDIEAGGIPDYSGSECKSDEDDRDEFKECDVSKYHILTPN